MSLRVYGDLNVTTGPGAGTILAPEFGGTGTNNLQSALLAMLPDTANNDNKVLTVTSNQQVSWEYPGVSVTGGETGLTFNDNGNGISVLQGVLDIGHGGTGASNVEEARVSLGLGTAAISDITTSNSDRTIGHVLKVGDYGIGSSITHKPVVATNITDLRDYPIGSVTVVYGTSAEFSDAGMPTTQSSTLVYKCLVIHQGGERDSVIKLSIMIDGSEADYVLYRSDDVYGQWSKFYTDQDIIPLGSGGTGVDSLDSLKTILSIDEVGVGTDTKVIQWSSVHSAKLGAFYSIVGTEAEFIANGGFVLSGVGTNDLDAQVTLYGNEDQVTAIGVISLNGQDILITKTKVGETWGNWTRFQKSGKVVTVPTSGNAYQITSIGDTYFAQGTSKVLTLPPSPFVGDTVTIIPGAAGMSVSGGNGRVLGATSNHSLTTTGVGVTFIYINQVFGWAIK